MGVGFLTAQLVIIESCHRVILSISSSWPFHVYSIGGTTDGTPDSSRDPYFLCPQRDGRRSVSRHRRRASEQCRWTTSLGDSDLDQRARAWRGDRHRWALQ